MVALTTSRKRSAEPIAAMVTAKVPRSDVDKINAFYRSDDNAMLVAPFPQLGNKIAVEAWTYLSKCTHFNDKAFTKFRDALRYHGPEKYPKSLLQPGQ